MSVEQVRLAWEILTGLLAAAAFVFSWYARNSHAQKASLEQLQSDTDRRFERIERDGNMRHTENLTRLTGLEEAMKHMPTNRDLDHLSQALALNSNVVSEIKGGLASNTRMVERMNQYLMERGT
jgi:hypothetical protein